MRTSMLVAGLTVLGLLAVTMDAEGVPSFTRQTGLTCNQCHVSFGGPVPNFTFTGKKFRLNGYRMPFVGDKIEAGEVGAINGRRLAIPLIPYLSLRYQSLFASQRKGAERRDALGAEIPNEAGEIVSNPTSRLSLFPGGAFGDNFGVWIEFYLTPDGSTEQNWTQGLFSFDEYDLRYVFLRENTTFGLAFSNQSIRELGGFGPWPVGLTSHMNRAGFRGWSHTNRAAFFAYGYFNDRVLAAIGAGPGEDNFEWDRQFFQGQLAVAPLNTDANEAWLTVMVQAGNDGIPIVSGISPARDGTLSFNFRDAVSGISATRPSGAGPYVSTDLGDYYRILGEGRYGFIDRGMHSLESALRVTVTNEDYADGADVTQNSFGGALRYVYDRTWGLDLVSETVFNFDFTDMSGTKHEIDTTPSYRGYLTYRPAMNIILGLNYGNSQSRFLDFDATTGWSWSFNIDYLF